MHVEETIIVIVLVVLVIIQYFFHQNELVVQCSLKLGKRHRAKRNHVTVEIDLDIQRFLLPKSLALAVGSWILDPFKEPCSAICSY